MIYSEKWYVNDANKKENTRLVPTWIMVHGTGFGLLRFLFHFYLDYVIVLTFGASLFFNNFWS